MLYEFVTTYRAAIIERSKEKLTARPRPAVSPAELANGVPLFLTQLADVLRDEEAGEGYTPTAIGSGGQRHGRDLLALGFTVSQVVHDYGDICQAITELAGEQNTPITTEEFHTLNRCLDTAIAEAVTEHARLTAQARYTEDAERSGFTAHENRDLINTAILAFETLKRGTVAINGSTGAVLGRTLLSMRDLVNGTLTEIRLAGDQQRRERIPVAAFIQNIAAAGYLHAQVRGLTFTTEPVDADLAVNADPELFASAVTNLLNNAFKFTSTGGKVVLRAHGEHDRLLIEVEDECGGIPESAGDLFEPFCQRTGRDRTGLGLGLSMSRKIVRAHGGEIQVRNAPGHGCTFAVVVPLAAKDVPEQPAVT